MRWEIKRLSVAIKFAQETKKNHKYYLNQRFTETLNGDSVLQLA